MYSAPLENLDFSRSQAEPGKEGITHLAIAIKIPEKSPKGINLR